MKHKVRAFILKSFLFCGDESLLADDDSLLDRGILDSTGVVELVAFLEEAFGVSIDDDELLPENLDSVSRIMAFLDRKGVPASATART